MSESNQDDKVFEKDKVAEENLNDNTTGGIDSTKLEADIDTKEETLGQRVKKHYL